METTTRYLINMQKYMVEGESIFNKWFSENFDT